MILAASFDTRDNRFWENRGLMYGDGVFETMRCSHHSVPLWPWHRQRLEQSLTFLKMDPPDFDAIMACIQNRTSPSQVILRLTVFRQHSKRGYQPDSRDCHWLISQFTYQDRQQPQILGIARQRLTPQPLLNDLKHLNRLPQVLIAGELTTQDVDDLVVLNEDNQVIETTCQNLVVVDHQNIYTPDRHACGVAGVALTWLTQQLPIQTKTMTLADIKNAQSLLTANAVHGFRPVKAIKSLCDYQINNPICDRISDLWQQLID